jgi:hypothetical protein
MRTFALAVLCAFVLCSCAQTRVVKTKIYGDRGQTISLRKEVSADAVPVAKGYSHPITFEPEDLKYIMSSIGYQEKGLFGWSDTQRLFTAEQLYRLTPHLLEGLAKATPDDEVLFSSTGARSGFLFATNRYTDGSMFVKDGKVNFIFGNINVKNDVDVIYEGDPRKEYAGVLSRLVVKDWQRLVEGEKGTHYNWIELDYDAGLAKRKRRERLIQERLERRRAIIQRREKKETGWEDWESDEAIEEPTGSIEDDVFWPEESP